MCRYLFICYSLCGCRVGSANTLFDCANLTSGYQISLTGNIIAFRGFVLQYGEPVGVNGAIILRADHLGMRFSIVAKYGAN
jgi:hypothetical protein